MILEDFQRYQTIYDIMSLATSQHPLNYIKDRNNHYFSIWKQVPSAIWRSSLSAASPQDGLKQHAKSKEVF
jgi:hypothetical protein